MEKGRYKPVGYKRRPDLRKELRAGHSGHKVRAKPAAQQVSSTVMQNTAHGGEWPPLKDTSTWM